MGVPPPASPNAHPGAQGKGGAPKPPAQAFSKLDSPDMKRSLRCKGNSPNLYKRRKEQKVDPSTSSLRSSHSLPVRKTKWGFARPVPKRVALRNFLGERRSWSKAAGREAAAWALGWERRRSPQPRPCRVLPRGLAGGSLGPENSYP